MYSTLLVCFCTANSQSLPYTLLTSFINNTASLLCPARIVPLEQHTSTIFLQCTVQCTSHLLLCQPLSVHHTASLSLTLEIFSSFCSWSFYKILKSIYYLGLRLYCSNYFSSGKFVHCSSDYFFSFCCSCTVYPYVSEVCQIEFWRHSEVHEPRLVILLIFQK